MRARAGRIVGLTLLGAGALLMGSLPASAQSVVTGPVVTLDRYEMAVGDAVVLTIDGFVGNGVTISVCGNEARRGSSDCNMPASEGKGLRSDGTPTIAEMPVYAPPVPCPCVIRVSTANSDQVAVVPITLLGHPVAPVVSPDVVPRSAVDVSIVANEATEGVSNVIRSGLGGASIYELTVTVRNRTSEPVEQVTLSGSAGRTATQELVTLVLSDPGPLGGGETWQETVSAELPALTFGEVEWQVTATGGPSSVQATDTTSDQPVLLIVLGIVLFIDLLVLMIRLITRRRRSSNGPSSDQNPFTGNPDGDLPGGVVDVAIEAEHREPQLIG